MSRDASLQSAKSLLETRLQEWIPTCAGMSVMHRAGDLIDSIFQLK
jgi:hypothetical protein